MPIINSLISWINLKRLNQIDDIRHNPFYHQEETFKYLIWKADKTEYGKMYDFRSIDSIEKFQSRVPLMSYEDLQPFIHRMMEGESNILWPRDVKWYAKSSGTTNDKSKYIPVSRDSLEECHFKGGRDVFVLYTQNVPDTKTYTGKGLTLGGSHQVSNVNDQSRVGDLSAIYIENVPFFLDLKRTPEASIALIDEFEEKVKRIAEVSIKENVTSIVGVPSWNLIMLKYILEVTGKEHIHEIWPNLEVFVHGGINFEPYREQYQKILPNPGMNYIETYNASEGFFAIQDDLNDRSMLLMLDYGIFYEFIPFEDIDHEHPRTLTIADVETGKVYAVVISTNGGLWRYMLGDTIEFTSLYPHKIIIKGRTKHYINAFGEELMIENAEQALKTTCEKTGAIVGEYTAAPKYIDDNSKGRHQWLIEFEKEPASAKEFVKILDVELQKLNSDYEAKRKPGSTLDKPELIIARPGLFLDWMKKRGKVGGQNKIPRLANHREYIEELGEMNG